MQPYFFPYLGYFQLINAVDKFVIFDDVNYINKGWINRNNILVNDKAFMITLPLKEASQNKKILEIGIGQDSKAMDKLLKTIAASYKKAPYFEPVFKLIQSIFSGSTKSIAEFNFIQLKTLCDYIGIQTHIVQSARIYNNDELKGQQRIIDICVREKADEYINPIGGTELYDRKMFAEKRIQLYFLKPDLEKYVQFDQPFIPGLSIIDILMFNNAEQTKKMLSQFQLI